VIFWIFTVGGGFFALLRYSNTEGKPASAPHSWPKDTSIVRAHDRYSLLVFAHPQCPCTAASIEELAHIVATAHGQVDTYVLFYAPELKSEEWVHGTLWQNASIIPGITAIDDREGVEARRFEVATSGQALLYDREGLLQFSGGITASRGHEGGNDGRDAIVSLALNGYARRVTTPVFGCSLLGENRLGEDRPGESRP
jgi:hypothetical protein